MTYAREAGGADHFGKGMGSWKFADRFDEIAIRFGVTGDDAAQRRNHLEGKQIVDPVQARHIDAGKFQAQEPAAGSQHAKRFAECEVDARHVADAECDGIGIEAAAGESQRLGIALDERYLVLKVPRRAPALFRALSAHATPEPLEIMD